MAEGGFNLGFNAKNLFFDRAAVVQQAGKEAAKALARQASYIRQTARRSMKTARTKTGKQTKAAKTQAAGKPPLVRRGDLKRLLWFAWDPTTRSAVIGAVKFPNSDAPNVLEFGGTTIISRFEAGSPKARQRAATPIQAAAYRAKLLSGQLQRPPAQPRHRVRKVAKYRAFPYMGPAFEKSLAKFPQHWRGTVRAA